MPERKVQHPNLIAVPILDRPLDGLDDISRVTLAVGAETLRLRISAPGAIPKYAVPAPLRLPVRCPQ